MIVHSNNSSSDDSGNRGGSCNDWDCSVCCCQGETTKYTVERDKGEDKKEEKKDEKKEEDEDVEEVTVINKIE